MILEAIILAGGIGERFRPLTDKIPKPLLPFGKDRRMMIEYIFDFVKRVGVKDVTLALYYMPEAFKEKLGDGSRFGLNISYVVEDEPLGTAGFLRTRPITGTTLVINSDVIFANDFDFNAFYEKHKNSVANGAAATIALKKLDATEGLGTVKVDGDKIVSFVEKGNISNFVNTAYYLLEPLVMQHLPEQKKVMFEYDIFPVLAEQGKLYAYQTKADWIHIRDLDEYERLNKSE